MKVKLLVLTVLFLLCCVPLGAQDLPDFTFTDPVGDVSPASVDYVGGWFIQEGDSLFFGYQMAAPLADRVPWGNALNEFFLDIDADPTTGQFCGNENNLDFMDWGDGNWFGNFYVNWDWDLNSFMEKLSVPATVHADGKSLTCKISLVGTGWEEILYLGGGWYKEGSGWHQVPHYGGDAIDETQPYSFDLGQITQLVEKTGTNCVIKVPDPYSATADAKNITGVVDEMVNVVKTQIGTIAESDKKFSVGYENFTYYAHPCSYGFGGINQFGCRIPGTDWVDEPNWYAMLEGVVDQTLKERSAGLVEVFLGQKAYHRPIPGSGEGWYCTDDDSTNGFKWDAAHKWTMKSLTGDAYENCYVFHVAENLSDGDAKTAIMNKKAEMAAAWNDFSGTAEDLTPEIMTGLLLSLSDDLSWTSTIYTDIIPRKMYLGNTYDPFSQIVNNYIRNENYIIRSLDDFLTQAHHDWYATIASVQAAIISLATEENVYNVLQGITGFPLDQDIYNSTRDLLTTPAVDPYVFDDTVPYVWNEINSVGTAIATEDYTSGWSDADADDGAAGPIEMGIDFPFYGQTFDKIYIGVNGICSFTDHIDWITTSGYGMTIPGMGWDNILCPLACDIMAADPPYTDPRYDDATGTIYYYHNETEGTFTIEYEKMTNHMPEGALFDTTITFQVVLDTNGTITYYYKDLGTATEPVAKRATIGIQPGKESGLGSQYYGGNTPADGYPVAGSAIRFEIGESAIDRDVAVVTDFKLAQNYPNPFNPLTNLPFNLPNRCEVSLRVYNVLGEEVATLVNGTFMEPGYHTISWNASGLPSGIYFYRLDIPGQHSSVKKCVLMK